MLFYQNQDTNLRKWLKGSKKYLYEEVDNTQNNNKGMDGIFPVSGWVVFFVIPEEAPNKYPEHVDQRRKHHQIGDSLLLDALLNIYFLT